MLRAAEAAANEGGQKVVDRLIGAFIREVLAQSRRSLTSAHAATLIQKAKGLIT